MSEARDCLKYRMLGSQEPVGSWGHEYVRYCICSFLMSLESMLLSIAIHAVFQLMFAVAVFLELIAERQTSSCN